MIETPLRFFTAHDTVDIPFFATSNPSYSLRSSARPVIAHNLARQWSDGRFQSFGTLGQNPPFMIKWHHKSGRDHLVSSFLYIHSEASAFHKKGGGPKSQTPERRQRAGRPLYEGSTKRRAATRQEKEGVHDGLFEWTCHFLYLACNLSPSETVTS